jgi:hypothetical protein
MFMRIILVVISCLVLLSSANSSFDLDVDDDGKTEALTDGLLVIRYLFGFSEEALVVGAIASEASRNRPEDIRAFLKNNESKLDIDNNASVTALTDGLLVIRYLFGFSGDALTSGAISVNANRVDAQEITTYFSTIVDSDNDEFNDAIDAFISDPNEWADSDSDGIGNNEDPDDDNDGLSDSDEFGAGSDPLTANQCYGSGGQLSATGYTPSVNCLSQQKTSAAAAAIGAVL